MQLLFFLCELFAQAEPSASPINIPGVELSGWAGTGLLGIVLGWLLTKHLPDKDRQFTELIANHTKQTAELVVEHRKEMKEQTDSFNKVLIEKRTEFTVSLADQRRDFKESLKEVTDHCERETAHVTGAMTNDLKILHESVKELSAAVHSLVRK